MGRLLRARRHRTMLSGFAVVASALMLSCGDEPVQPCPPVAEATGVILASHGRELYRQVNGVPQGAIALAPGGLVHAIECTFVDAAGQAIALAGSCDSLGVNSSDAGIASISRDAGLPFYFNVSGEAAGQTTVQLHLQYHGHAAFTPLPIPVAVAAPVP